MIEKSQITDYHRMCINVFLRPCSESKTKRFTFCSLIAIPCVPVQVATSSLLVLLISSRRLTAANCTGTAKNDYHLDLADSETHITQFIRRC